MAMARACIQGGGGERRGKDVFRRDCGSVPKLLLVHGIEENRGRWYSQLLLLLGTTYRLPGACE